MQTIVEVIKFILDTMIAIGLLFIIVYIIEYLKLKIQFEKQDKILSDVKIAVTSAEQQYVTGDQKKDYTESLLTIMGYDIDDKMNAIIETTVNKLFPFHCEDEELYIEDDDIEDDEE